MRCCMRESIDLKKIGGDPREERAAALHIEKLKGGESFLRCRPRYKGGGRAEFEFGWQRPLREEDGAAAG